VPTPCCRLAERLMSPTGQSSGVFRHSQVIVQQQFHRHGNCVWRTGRYRLAAIRIPLRCAPECRVRTTELKSGFHAKQLILTTRSRKGCTRALSASAISTTRPHPQMAPPAPVGNQTRLVPLRSVDHAPRASADYLPALQCRPRAQTQRRHAITKLIAHGIYPRRAPDPAPTHSGEPAVCETAGACLVT